MRNFALKSPFATGLTIFLVIFIGGTLAGVIFSFVIAAIHRSPIPEPPNDGDAMAMGMIWSLSFMASLVLGIFAGISSIVILKLNEKP